MRKRAFIFIFILNTLFAFSQNKQMKNTLEDLKNISEDSLINLAFTILKEKSIPHKINIKDYEITVQTSEKNILVELSRIIKFRPLGSENCHYIYDISINMMTEKVFPFDLLYNSGVFFELNESQKKQIGFLKKVTVLPYPDFENEVVETENTFEIHITNETSIAIISIDKVTGEQLSELNGHFSTTPPPDFSDD